MIGNDVIDLARTRVESNWRRKGFLEKLFRQEEQAMIASHPDPELLVWLLWSMKESVYKIWNRHTNIRCYNPKKWCCSIDQQHHKYMIGKVFYLEDIYYTKSVYTHDYIHTIAVKDEADLALVIEVEKEKVAKDNHGLPYLCANATRQNSEVSVSHHGRFEKVVTIRRVPAQDDHQIGKADKWS